MELNNLNDNIFNKRQWTLIHIHVLFHNDVPNIAFILHLGYIELRSKFMVVMI